MPLTPTKKAGRPAEVRYNHNHDPVTGRFVSSSGVSKRYFNGGTKTIDKSEKSGIIKSSDKISALGANKFENGFSENNLNEHWGGSHDHSAEYPGFTKEQYAQRALELIQSAADGKNILGYKLQDGTIARYDVKNNDYVKGHPNVGISTMFKPKRKAAYFHDRKRVEKGMVK